MNKVFAADRNMYSLTVLYSGTQAILQAAPCGVTSHCGVVCIVSSAFDTRPLCRMADTIYSSIPWPPPPPMLT